MKILHITIGLPPYTSGGLPIYTRDLAVKESMLGNNVYILQPGKFLKLNTNTRIRFR